MRMRMTMTMTVMVVMVVINDAWSISYDLMSDDMGC
jgi:hypothetical protein